MAARVPPLSLRGVEQQRPGGGSGGRSASHHGICHGPGVYDLLRTQFGFYIIAAEEFLTAGLATEEEARLLAIARGDAIVRLERIACSFGEERVEFRRCSGRGDHFRYHVRLR